ncbi:MAG: hypothetical protein Q9162_007795 [Coniocarpon cinnabarinum]
MQDICPESADGKDPEEVDATGHITPINQDKAEAEHSQFSTLSEPSSHAGNRSDSVLRWKLEVYQGILTYLETVFALTGWSRVPNWRGSYEVMPRWQELEARLSHDYQGFCMFGTQSFNPNATASQAEQRWMKHEIEYFCALEQCVQPETKRRWGYVDSCLIDVKRMFALAVQELTAVRTELSDKTVDDGVRGDLINLTNRFDCWDGAIRSEDERRRNV